MTVKTDHHLATIELTTSQDYSIAFIKETPKCDQYHLKAEAQQEMVN